MNKKRKLFVIFLDFLFFICQNCAWTKEKEPFGSVFRFSFGDIAQLVEQMTFNHWVQGSSPCVPTKNINRNAVLFFDWAKRTRTMSQGSTTSRFDQCNAVKSSRLPHSRRASAVRGNPCVPTKKTRGFPRFFVYFTDCFSSVIAVPSNC